MSFATPLVTAEELDHFPDDGKRREIIGGELFVSPAPAKEHQDLSGEFYSLLRQAVLVTGWGRVYYAPVDVQFSTLDQVQPDLLIIRQDRLDLYRGHTFFGAPDIVVEIISPSNPSYDEIEKAALYAANGVPEYWMANPTKRTFCMLVLRDGRFADVEPVNGIYHSTVVPNLVVDPAVLFAALDF